MDQIFNETNYRNYLENVYMGHVDKDNYARKKEIDKYSTAFLQKILDDTKGFSIYAINELRKEKDNLIDSVFMMVELTD